MNDFVTVFTVPKNIDASILILIIPSLVFIAICIAEIVLRKKGRRGIFPWPTLTMPPIFGIVVGSILLIGASAILINSIIKTNRLVSAYKDGEYEIVEGIVHVLHKQTADSHDKVDVVKIGNTEFVINSSRFTPGYNLTIADGGVLKDGVYARVYHQKGTIMRIDIRKTKTDDNPIGTNGGTNRN